MIHRVDKALTILILSLFLLGAAGSITIRGNGGYDISWWTADGSRGTSSGADYVLQGSTGQPDAGDLNGGSYVLQGSFPPGGKVGGDHSVYLPVTLRQFQ